MLNTGVFLLNQVLISVIIIPIKHAHRGLFDARAEGGRLTYTLQQWHRYPLVPSIMNSFRLKVC